MKKRMTIMLIAVGLLIGGLVGYNYFKGYMMQKYMGKGPQPPATVSAMKAEYQLWQPQLNAVGTLRAVRGVDVTTEVGGLVRSINFKSGDEVKAGQVLAQLNADSDIAQLHSLEAAAELASIVYERDKAQLAAEVISKAQVDTDAGPEEQAGAGRAAAGGGGKEDLAGAVRRQARHQHRQSRSIPESSRQAGHFADHRSYLRRLLSAAAAAAAGHDRPDRDADHRHVQGRDLRREDQCDQPQDRYQHPQRADRGHDPQRQATAAARNVRQRQGQLGRGKSLSHASADRDHLQSLRRHGVRGEDVRQEGRQGRKRQPALAR